jgi:hypothetical protein
MGKTKTGGTGIMNFEILGIGIAVTFAIIALSAVILYLAFRIKETFREEKSLKIQVAKTFFLIGILFLAGGMFYFFANALYPQKTDTNSSKMIESGSYAKNGSVFLGVSYPANIKTDDIYTISFKTYNPSSNVIHNGVIKVVGLSLLETKSNFNIESDSLALGDIPPGETSGYMLLKSPSYPVVLEGKLIFQSQDTGTATESVKINVLETTLLPSPTPTHTPNSSSSGSTGMPWYINIWPSVPASTSVPSSSSKPTPDPTAAPTSSTTPTPIPTSTPTPNSTPTPIPTFTPTSNSTTPVPTPTPDPTAAPTSNSTTPVPTPTPDPTAAPTPNSTTPAPTPTPDPTAAPTPNSTTPAPTPTPDPTTTQQSNSTS